MTRPQSSGLPRLIPYVALLRGVNVGRARRVAMSDLRALLERLGYADVRTVLNSGNAVFRAAEPDPARVAAAVEAALRGRLGLPAPVIAVTAREMDAVVAGNPLAQAGADPARFLVAFVPNARRLEDAAPLLAREWAPEALALGTVAAYLWCPDGIVRSKVVQAFSRATADAATARNWSTVLRLQAALRALPDTP